METQGTTSLTDAVIRGTDSTSHNTFTTGILVLTDMKNRADYKVSNKGIAYNKFEKGAHDSYNEKAFIPVLMPGASDKDSSITKSAIGALSNIKSLMSMIGTGLRIPLVESKMIRSFI